MSETLSTLPQTIAIIMDGNRRFAEKKNLSKSEGHKQGFEKLIEVCEWARTEEIKHVIVYAFSTENWKREEGEVSSLMELLRYALTSEKLRRVDTKIQVIGDTTLLPLPLQIAVKAIQNDTKDNTPNTLTIALSYGGRAEIVSAVNSLIKEGISSVDEKNFEEHLWGSDCTPDLVLRTGGDYRISNFLLWQIAYSELFFTKTLWPEFSQEEFKNIIAEYTNRKRNFGK